jgi:hypothetical protein
VFDLKASNHIYVLIALSRKDRKSNASSTPVVMVVVRWPGKFSGAIEFACPFFGSFFGQAKK